MTYVDAVLIHDTVHVSERHADGTRRLRTFPAPYEFYTPDPAGKHEGMKGERLKLTRFQTGQQFRKAKFDLGDRPVWEADVRVEFKVLEKEYLDQPQPDLHLSILDIEVDVDPDRGFPSYVNAYGPINAVTVYQKWRDQSITIVVPPAGMEMDQAESLVEGIPDTYVVESEAELLMALLELLDDADVVSGWHSELFDLPYVIARIRAALGGEDPRGFRDEEMAFDVSAESRKWLKRLCLFGQIPRKKEIEKFGSKEVAFDLVGRVQLDYLELYRKFTFVEQHSYKLNHILQVEVNQTKVAFDGPIWDLYRNNFRLFTLYNRQDTEGLAAIDRKLGFVDLANQMAHMAGVRLPQVFGSVAIIGQAILLELHRQGRVAPSVVPGDDQGPVAGAFVYEPEGGMYDWVASYDIMSLYPSIIRMLNISPDTIIGQFLLPETEAFIKREMDRGLERGEAWGKLTGVLEYHAVVDGGGDQFQELTLRLEDGSLVKKTGAEWNEFFSTNDLCLTANGTVFDTSKQGIIPFCLARWYKDRKESQSTSERLLREAEELKKARSMTCPEGV